MQIVYSREQIPDQLTKSIFLAGPTPRTDKVISWRKEALNILNELEYDGVVFVPENRKDKFDKKYLDEQIEWEHMCLKAADVIVFWIPRELREDFEMIALTTNVEFGLFLNSEKLFIGSPNDAEKNTYLQKISQDKYEWHDSLTKLLDDALDYIGDGALRKKIECKIPLKIFLSSQFSNWYNQQLTVGNELRDFNLEYQFVMPKAKKIFLVIFKPSVYIKEEDRIKDNEFVIARTDMSYILAFYKNNEDIMNSSIIICREFRSPIRNEKEFVYELPGGSSLNQTDDVLDTAAKELEEETGLSIDKDRFSHNSSRQSAATICSHKIDLFSVELNEKEFNDIKNNLDKTHGVAEDTELIHLEIMTLNDILENELLDWTNVGMIFDAILKNK